MNPQVLDGRAVARDMKARALDELKEIRRRYDATPSLWVVGAGNDPSAQAYQRAIIRTATSVGIDTQTLTLPFTATQSDLNDAIDRLNVDSSVTGIIVLQPLPPHLSRVEVADRLHPLKDIDGITTFNAGRLFHDDRDVLAPSTPAGGMALLKFYGIEIAGKHAIVVGRSPVVGKPMALMLLAENATVAVCHSYTKGLADVTRQADILVSAVGRPGAITADMVKPGATVIDFGVNFVNDKMCGDVDFDAVSEVASAITPVPGGTGRVTTMVLVRHTLKAMRLQHEASGTNLQPGVISNLVEGNP